MPSTAVTVGLVLFPAGISSNGVPSLTRNVESPSITAVDRWPEVLADVNIAPAANEDCCCCLDTAFGRCRSELARKNDDEVDRGLAVDIPRPSRDMVASEDIIVAVDVRQTQSKFICPIVDE